MNKSWDYTGKSMMYCSTILLILGWWLDYRCLIIGCTTLIVGSILVLVSTLKSTLHQLETQTEFLKTINMRVQDLRDYAEQDNSSI